MLRRGFLKALGALMAPAFIPASRLWLPPERPAVVAPPAFLVASVDMASGEYTIGSLDGLFYKLYAEQVAKTLRRNTILTDIVAGEDYAAGEWASLDGGRFAIPLALR